MAQDHRRTAAGTVVAVAGSLSALLLAAPAPPDALAVLADLAASTDPTAPVVAVVALVAWAVTGWLTVTVAVVLLSRVPGLLGTAARTIARGVAPVAVRRTVEAALGLTVAVGVVAPSAALASPVPAPVAGAAAGPVAGSDHGWDLDWPDTGTAGPVVPSTTATARATPAPTLPRAAATPAPPVPPPVRASAAPPARSSPVPVRPTAGAPPKVAAPVPAAASHARTVVVRPGDSLWSIAESSLRRSSSTAPTDRQVAQAWPRWWAANREVVGDDPDLLLPGTVLRLPGGLDQP